MEKIKTSVLSIMNSSQDLTLLAIRLVLAYGFYTPMMGKLQNFDSTVSWFANSLHLPFPWLNAVMAIGTEISGIALLTVGFMTRLISIPLIVVMLVAITTIHWSHGFNAGDNGFEIPLYYILMLLTLIGNGAGKISLDRLIFKK